MYRIRLVIVILFFAFTASAQNQEKNFTEQIIISDINGRPFEKYSPEIQGSPFLSNDFFIATLILHNGKKLDSIKVRIDFYKQEIDLKMADNIEAIAGRGMIKEIYLRDSLQPSKILYNFRSGFPEIDNQDQTNYYEVLCDGKIIFLKSIRKKITETKNEISGETTKEFETYEDYYVFIDKAMQRIKRANQFFTNLMIDKKKEIEKFINENNINCKNVGKAQLLISYYNSLF